MTTWNPADKTADIVLSGGNLTATNSVNTADGVRSTTQKLLASGGKFYFEFPTILLSNSSDWVGLANSSWNETDGLASSNTIGLSQGGIFGSGGGFDVTGLPDPSGHVACFALDLVNSKIWGRLDAGIWNNSGTANPTTNVGGFNIPGSSGWFGAVRLQANSGSPHATVNFGASAFVQAIPSGFTSWDAFVLPASSRGLIVG